MHAQAQAAELDFASLSDDNLQGLRRLPERAMLCERCSCHHAVFFRLCHVSGRSLSDLTGLQATLPGRSISALSKLTSMSVSIACGWSTMSDVSDVIKLRLNAFSPWMPL